MNQKVLSCVKPRDGSRADLFPNSTSFPGSGGALLFCRSQSSVAHLLTSDACLLVLFVNEQVARRVWEEGDGEKLNEGRNCAGCHENRPEIIYAENLPETKPELSNHTC